MASMSAVAGVLPRVVRGEQGILTWEIVSKVIRPHIYYRPQTALISLENTHNMAGGTVYPTKQAHEICDRAHDAGISVHLDGARVFNAATYLNEDVAEMTKKFDSIQFCLSKGLGAPVGSMIVGSRDFIERCRSLRKMLGGGMRQVGVLAAAGLVALDNGPKRLHVDHENAKVLANELANVKTNIVILDVRKSGWASGDILNTLAQQGVLAVPVDNDKIRMVTHLDVNRNAIEKAANITREVFQR
jgi:threonine aldolase